MKSYHAIIIMSIWMAMSLLLELLGKNALRWMALGVMTVYMGGVIFFIIKEWNEET